MKSRHAFLGAVFACAALLMPASSAFANCEGISNAFAYNECLAKQGPARGTSRAPRAARGVDPEATVRGKARYSPSRESVGEAGASGITISRRRGGRSSAVIDPWAAVKRGFSGPSRNRRR